ncbi:hypothetical protein HispidOSU_004136 [Sigmodon hispidus]
MSDHSLASDDTSKGLKPMQQPRESMRKIALKKTGGPNSPTTSAPRGPLLPALRVVQANLQDHPWNCAPQSSRHNLGPAWGGGYRHLQNNRNPESTLVLAPGAAFPIAG